MSFATPLKGIYYDTFKARLAFFHDAPEDIKLPSLAYPQQGRRLKMKNVQFSYAATVSQTGLISIAVPSHFVAILVADKLGLPMPTRNDQCEVNSVVIDDRKEGEHMVNIDFEYMARVDTAPITLSIPSKVDTAADDQPET